MAPAVREAEVAAEPVRLELVETSPGNFQKLNAADKAAWEKSQADAAYTRGSVGRAEAAAAAAAKGESAESGVIPLTILTKSELASIAKGRGLKATGSKDAIAAAIAGGTSDDAEDAPPAAPASEGDGA